MKTVSVLLSTYNGSDYIEDQIKSVLGQKGVKVRLFVRDDGSSDKTVQIINKLVQRYSEIKFLEGKNCGYTRSFFELSRLASDTSDYYAFCDQDDIWLSDKLISAVTKLEAVKSRYSLYFSGLTLVDKHLNKIGVKKYNLHDITFGRSMIRNSVAGCTMVFNNELNTLSHKTKEINDLTGHDAWLLRLTLAIGGKVIYDNSSHILFRRYGENTTSSGTISFKRVLEELSLNRSVGIRYRMVKIISENYSSFISDKNKNLINDLSNYRQSTITKVKLITNSELSYSFFPVSFISKIQILFNKY